MARTSSLNPDYFGGMSHAAGTGRRRAPRGGGQSHGPGKGGRGGGGGFLAPFSTANEAAALHAGTHGLRSGTTAAIEGTANTPGLRTGEKRLLEDYSTARGDIKGGLATGRSDLTTGRDTALDYYKPFAEAAAGAAPLYSDALGLGGAAGHDRATGAFQAGPGYEFAMGQGLEGIDRLRASSGGAGAADIDTLKFSQGLANEEYNNWLANLKGEQDTGVAIAGQQAGLEANTGVNLANLGQQASGTLANINTAQGGQQYDHAKDLADLAYKKKTGIGGLQAGFQLSKNQTGQNIVGAGMGALTTGLTAGNVGGFGAPRFSSPTAGGTANPFQTNPFAAAG